MSTRLANDGAGSFGIGWRGSRMSTVQAAPGQFPTARSRSLWSARSTPRPRMRRIGRPGPWPLRRGYQRPQSAGSKGRSGCNRIDPKPSNPPPIRCSWTRYKTLWGCTCPRLERKAFHPHQQKRHPLRRENKFNTVCIARSLSWRPISWPSSTPTTIIPSHTNGSGQPTKSSHPSNAFA